LYIDVEEKENEPAAVQDGGVKSRHVDRLFARSPSLLLIPCRDNRVAGRRFPFLRSDP
jgi:hypothetical protein